MSRLPDDASDVSGLRNGLQAGQRTAHGGLAVDGLAQSGSQMPRRQEGNGAWKESL